MTAGIPTHQPDYESIKTKQQATWASGHYLSIGALIVYMSENLCEDADIGAGQTVLDIATGTGNSAIAAARRGADVTGVDYVDTFLEQAKKRMEAEGVSARWQIADIEDLPFNDNSFDVVTSVCGVMFAPNQEKAASEMVRVVKPGGKIVTANWTPDGFIGALLKVVGSFVSPPPGLNPPVRWGTRDGVKELLGESCELQFVEKDQVFRFKTAQDFTDLFIERYGPLERAHASLDAEHQESLRTQVTELVSSWSNATDGTVRVPGAYLETTAVRN